MAKEPTGKSPGEKGANESANGVSTGGWNEKVKITRKNFPGPPGASEPLRVAMTRETYAELTAHAKESLNAEIGGVLMGELCEDNEGPFVLVQGTIRAAAAREGSTHVTFTQETWTRIHQEKDRKYPRLQMVGWYHTHPGFGVEFSEMDRFVHRNFFSGPGHIAFVADPLGGQEAILVNAGGELVAVSRFWVDGRERRCQAPVGNGESAAGASANPAGIEKAMRTMEDRMGQLMQMVDAQTAAMHRFLLYTGMVVAVGVVFFLGYSIYSAYVYNNKPPEVAKFVPVPVQIGDKSVLLGVGIVSWEIPPSLNAAMVQIERERQAAEKAKAAATQSSTTQPATEMPATQPAK